MKRILVPVNCDEASEMALKLATELSKASNARVYVLSVIKTHGGAYFDKDGEIVQDQARDVQKYVDQKIEQTVQLKEWTEAINPEAFQVVRYGGVADVILDVMKKYKVSLVILGNKFHHSNEAQFFGKLTSYLIRKSTAPILSIKKELKAEDLNHIVFANEFDHKLSYYDALQDLHLFFKTKVDFLKIKTSEKIQEETIKENMDYFARINMIKDHTNHIYRFNKVESGILQWISENPCDLLAVKNITITGGSPLFKKDLSKSFLKNMNVSTLIYND